MALDDELGALNAGGGSDIDRRSGAVVGATGYLRDGIGLGVQYILLGQPRLVLTDVLEADGRTVIAIGDDALIFDDECTHLPSLAVGVLRPDASHAQIALVEGKLLLVDRWFLTVHFRTYAFMQR